MNIDIEKSKLEKYIEGFNYVYQYYDKSIAHETNFGRISHAVIILRLLLHSMCVFCSFFLCLS